eukprot:6633397-Lingulodinium_polyedra.AAC.1
MGAVCFYSCSAENPKEVPTRGRPIRPPARLEPAWLSVARQGRSSCLTDCVCRAARRATPARH